MNLSRITVRELKTKPGLSPSAISMTLHDEHLLFAARVMLPAELALAYVVASRVDVYRHGRTHAIAEIELVVDPEFIPAYAVMAAIEARTGAAALTVEAAAADNRAAVLRHGPLFPHGGWKRGLSEGDFNACVSAGRFLLQMTWTQILPPDRTVGIRSPDQCVLSHAGTPTRIGDFFNDEGSHRAIEDRAMFLESRLAWAVGSAGGNLEFCQAQLVPKGIDRLHRTGELVASFPDRGQMRLASERLNALCQIYELRRGQIFDE